MSRRIIVVIALVALLAFGTASAVPAQRVLVVEDTVTGETYLTTPVENGTTVALEYEHSVEKTRVYDGYTVRGDQLVMTRMEFESYGWGLPSGANVTRENGTLVYDPPGSYARITVAPGDVAGHTLHVGDGRYDLVAMTDDRSVDIRIERRSAIEVSMDALDS
jgi:hypothetical protein